MKFVAKVFKNGDSLAVRLLILYDEKERKRAQQERLQAFEELIRDIRNNPIEDDFETPRV